MYLMYIDHSGEPADVNDKHLVMAGLAVFERQIYHLQQSLAEVQREFLPTATEMVEFHASAIRRADREPWKSLERAKREELLLAVYQTIASTHSSGSLFGQVIEKDRIVSGYATQLAAALASKRGDQKAVKSESGKEKAEAKIRLRDSKRPVRELTNAVVGRAFEGLCTQFEFFLRRFYDPDKPDLQQRGLMILDHASYEQEAETLSHQFRSYGTREVTLHNISEVPLFAHSDATRMLQMADFVSFALFRRYESGDSTYFDRIAHRFDEQGGVVHGLSHVAAQTHSCMCPACLTRRLTRSA